MGAELNEKGVHHIWARQVEDAPPKVVVTVLEEREEGRLVGFAISGARLGALTVPKPTITFHQFERLLAMACGLWPAQVQFVTADGEMLKESSQLDTAEASDIVSYRVVDILRSGFGIMAQVEDRLKMARTPPQINVQPNPTAIANVTAGASEPHLTFSMVIEKVPGMTLGIDVTYSSAATWTKHGVFISQVAKDGLIAKSNAMNEEPYRVLPGDFIFQVNDVHGNTQKMVQEMKAKPTLSMHILRRNPSSAQKMAPSSAKDAPTDANADRSTSKLSAPVQALLPQLLSLDDKALSSFICVCLERRPMLLKEVLDDVEDSTKEEQSGSSSEIDKTLETTATEGEPDSAITAAVNEEKEDAPPDNMTRWQ